MGTPIIASKQKATLLLVSQMNAHFLHCISEYKLVFPAILNDKTSIQS